MIMLISYYIGMKSKQSEFLNTLPYVHGVLTLNTTKSYFPNGACRFKPIMFLEFIEMYNKKKHGCRFFFYGDAVSWNKFCEFCANCRAYTAVN